MNLKAVTNKYLKVLLGSLSCIKPVFMSKDMQNKLAQFISNKRAVIIIYFGLALAVSMQSLLLSPKSFDSPYYYKDYNNYLIFKHSFQHLKNNQNLYILYPEEHWDLYKYTPSFAVFMGFFDLLPDWIGLSLWSLLNVMILLLGIYHLPKLNHYQKGLIALIVVIELLTSIQNHQPNALIAGLIILSFGLLERNKPFLATLSIICSVFIKLFGLVGLAVLLFYPKKVQSVLYTLFWVISILILPLLFIDLAQYLKLYSHYLDLLQNDYGVSYGYSVMGWLYTWFSIELDKIIIVAGGVFMFLLPLYHSKRYKYFTFRYLILSSILVWVVIFNHKAESPTFIIAMAGVALWFVKSQKQHLNSLLFVGAFIFTSLSPTDIFPSYLREVLVKPYVLKGFPCILIWFKMTYDLVRFKSIKYA